MADKKGIQGELAVLSESEFRGNQKCKVVVVKEYKGKAYCHIRNFYKNSDKDEWGFGKGISLDAFELNSLLQSKALETALEKLNKFERTSKKGNTSLD